ncbi:MAG: hypothetical protein U9R17_17825 [Thermodesulfobacteriota bacterium]|nr:hypothetical protein [Thermodesulfobacteriota bacterium]
MAILLFYQSSSIYKGIPREFHISRIYTLSFSPQLLMGKRYFPLDRDQVETILKSLNFTPKRQKGTSHVVGRICKRET